MSEGDICSDDEKYGGFGAATAKSLHHQDRAAPTRAMAAVAAALTPGTKKTLSITAIKRTWLIKPPCKRQKESKQEGV